MGISLNFCCPKAHKRRNSLEHYGTLDQDDYKSGLVSGKEVNNLSEIKIKPKIFINENTSQPTDHYEKILVAGEGSFGTVLKVRHTKTNEFRAMKIIKKSNIDIGITKDVIINEINILKSLDHPNIMKIYEFFQDLKNYYLISEYCESGDLFTKLNTTTDKTFFNEKVTCSIMRQILSAISYLHSKNIIHGDLKLENILIYNEEQFKNEDNGVNNIEIKITDFGCSKMIKKEGLHNELIGTAYYMAPEVIKSNYNEKCDLWSCGVIMFILLSGTAPFPGKNEQDILSRISIGDFSFKHKIFNNVSKEAKDLITQLLTYDPEKRIDVRRALRHKFFTSQSEVNIIDMNYRYEVMTNLRNIKVEYKFQQAVITFITHNFIANEEIQNLRKVFKLLDKNSDGRISKTELQKGFKEIIGEVLGELEITKIMSNIDTDRNGYIEYEEFLRATLDKEKLLTEDNLKMAFELFDINKKGVISADDIKSTILGEKSIPDEVFEELLAQIDMKAEEHLHFEDFKGIMENIIKLK